MLKTKDIAQELHLSAGTIRTYARDGLIPCELTPGGHRRFDLEAVRDALRRLHATPPARLAEDGEVRVMALTDAKPLAIAPGWRSRWAIAAPALSDELDDDEPADSTEVPFLGVPGSSRFVLDREFAGV
jgi:MerR family regulatory protein